MATKLFKRTNSKDVFEAIASSEDQANTEPSDGIDIAPDAAETEAEKAHEVDRDEDGAREDDAGDGTDEASPTSRRRGWAQKLLTGAGAAILVAVLSAAGYAGWQLKSRQDLDQASTAALTAAQRYAVALTSIDSKSVDKNFTEVTDGATGEFKDMYSQSASQLRQVLIDNKANSKGIVIDSAVKSATKTKVEVLLFIDQWITNDVSPEPRMDRSRVAITMELVDGRWLAGKVNLK